MYEIDSKLKKLAQDGTPIHVSMIGCGQMGKDIIAQISKMDGMVCDIVVDLSTEHRSWTAIVRPGYAESDIVITDDRPRPRPPSPPAGKWPPPATRWLLLPPRRRSSSTPPVPPKWGARVTMECIFYKRHIVMMNVECDVTIGPLLRRMCEQAASSTP